MAECEEVGVLMTLSARVSHEHVSGVYCEGECVHCTCMYVLWVCACMCAA